VFFSLKTKSMKNFILIKSHSSKNNFLNFSFTSEFLFNVFEKFYITLIMTMLLNQSANSQANVYHPFPESNAVWIHNCGGISQNCYCNCAGSGNCHFGMSIADSLNGDTVINSKIFKKIYTAYTRVDYYFGPTNCPPWCTPLPKYTSVFYYYRGGIRQDSSSKKVYFIQAGKTIDTLLYDFNLNLGDTLHPTYICPANTNYVSSIDSVLVGGNYHKRYWISSINGFPPSSYTALIEGIGSTLGLFEMLFPPFEANCYLTCVKVNSNTIYPDGASCPSIPLKINEINYNLSFSISPNPFSNFTTLHAKENFNNVTLNIFNAFGQLVSQIKNINGNTININRNNLPVGFYFAQLSENNKVIGITKLIIVD